MKSYAKWLGACFGVCFLGALTSVLLETTHWWDIDAGTSWTIVCLLGIVLASAYGIRSAWQPFRFSRIIVASGLLSLAIIIILGGGFLLQHFGLAVPWELPTVKGKGFWFLAPLNQWLINLVWMGFWYGIAWVLLRIFPAMKRSATQP